MLAYYNCQRTFTRARCKEFPFTNPQLFGHSLPASNVYFFLWHFAWASAAPLESGHNFVKGWFDASADPVASSLACFYDNFRQGRLHHGHYEHLKTCQRSGTFTPSGPGIKNVAATWNILRLAFQSFDVQKWLEISAVICQPKESTTSRHRRYQVTLQL